MKKFIFCIAVFLVFSGCAPWKNCMECKANSDKDNANAGTEKALNQIDTQKTK